jgi:hypothetical protein
MVRLYYEWGPLLVNALEEDELFKKKIRMLVDEIITLMER